MIYEPKSCCENTLTHMGCRTATDVKRGIIRRCGQGMIEETWGNIVSS